MVHFKICSLWFHVGFDPKRDKHHLEEFEMPKCKKSEENFFRLKISELDL